MNEDVSKFIDYHLISQELPHFITETDPNNQAGNIEKILEKYFVLNGFAISIINNDTIVRHTNNKIINTNLLDELDRVFLGQETSEEREHTEAILFALSDGKISVNSDKEKSPSDLESENGLAILFNAHEMIGGMYLIANNQSIRTMNSDLSNMNNFLSLLSMLFINSYIHYQNAERMRFFSLYETVSSALGYVGDLQELLSTIISIVTAELPSEEGSVLLLDEKTNELEFFSVIGETGFGLTQMRFPADKGIAGYALQNREPIIVNDTQTCPYFFKNIDEDSGFKTKSILAVPLISGEECIGVIEAINKVGSDCFDEQDKRILIAIADEVALAIKNARLFDYVVDSYCNIRQGKMSCKGCVRPLKSWTPCARQLDKV